MAIQIPNPGTGNGATGDNEFVLWSKVKDNFSNQTHAASRLVGPAVGQIPLAQQTFKAAFKNTDSAAGFTDYNALEVGSRVFVDASGKLNEPPVILGDGIWVVETLGNHPSVDTRRSQIATNYTTGAVVVRALTTTWTAWQPIANNIGIYNQTTALGANVVVDATGKLMRSTSIAYTNTNTTKDSNGFIKAASPIVKVFADKAELNGEAEDQNVSYKKNGIGDYTITSVSGLSTDGWYIELPKDMNGNPKVAVTLSEVDGVISLKTYKRIFSMETFTFEPDLDNPLDVPDGRWIDLRLNEIPVEMPDDIQTEV